MNSTNLIAVGIGNTTIKAGRFDAQALLAPWPEPQQWFSQTTQEASFAALEPLLEERPQAWCVASVQRQALERLSDWVTRHRPQDEFRVLTHLDLPLEVRLPAPEKVGIDRLTAAVGANALRQIARPAVVVDTGTAITVNLVGPDGAFLGGAILPGIAMSARSLHDNADLLPWVNAAPGEAPPAALGRSTEEAIRGGLYWGAVGGIRELGLRLVAEQAAAPEWFLTGGDAAYFAPRLGLGARYVPHLVLGGIALAARARFSS